MNRCVAPREERGRYDPAEQQQIALYGVRRQADERVAAQQFRANAQHHPDDPDPQCVLERRPRRGQPDVRQPRHDDGHDLRCQHPMREHDQRRCRDPEEKNVEETHTLYNSGRPDGLRRSGKGKLKKG